MGEPYHERSVLIREYRENQLSTPEIADKYGVSSKTIQNWMRKNDVQIIRHPSFETLEKGYERVVNEFDGDRVRFYIHRLLAVSKFGFDEVCGKDVHHKNGVPWDNRPENIELMDKENHGRLHAVKQEQD